MWENHGTDMNPQGAVALGTRRTHHFTFILDSFLSVEYTVRVDLPSKQNASLSNEITDCMAVKYEWLKKNITPQ